MQNKKNLNSVTNQVKQDTGKASVRSWNVHADFAANMAVAANMTVTT